MDTPFQLPPLIGLYADDVGNGVEEATKRLQNYHGYGFYDFVEPVKLVVMPFLAGYEMNPRTIHHYAANPNEEIPGLGETFNSLTVRAESAYGDILNSMAARILEKLLKARQRIVLRPVNNPDRIKLLRDNGGKLVRVTNSRLTRIPFAELSGADPDFEIFYADDPSEITKGLLQMFRHFDGYVADYLGSDGHPTSGQ